MNRDFTAFSWLGTSQAPETKDDRSAICGVDGWGDDTAGKNHACRCLL